jgi:hypothetical protein
MNPTLYIVTVMGCEIYYYGSLVVAVCGSVIKVGRTIETDINFELVNRLTWENWNYDA